MKTNINKKKSNKCNTPYCKNKVRNKGSRKCGYCYIKVWREKNKEKHAFETLKMNAKRRKIFFDLTFEQFQQFCFKTNYLIGKGKTKESYSIDRIIESKGYTESNLQVLSLSNNTIKEHERRKVNKVLHYDYLTKTATVTNNIKQHDNICEPRTDIEPF